jgi:hypothetical protein
MIIPLALEQRLERRRAVGNDELRPEIGVWVPNIRIRMVDAQGRVRRAAVNAARLHRRGFV